MFHNATIRLSFIYAGILMLISLFFSINLYRVSTRELDAGLRHQESIYRQLPRVRELLNDDSEGLLLSPLDEARRRIVVNLVELNFLIAIVGGVGSYFLARRTLRPIEDAHEAQVRFTSDASHELRTPLAALQMETEVALRDPKLSLAAAKEVLRGNLDEVKKMTVLSEQLLSLSRLEDGLGNVHTTLREPITEAIKKLARLAREQKVAILADTIDGSAAISAEGLTQVTTILLDNALKYSLAGTAITISTGQDEAGVFISVTDQGRGIAPSDQKKIFDRFYRADQSRSKTMPGYGLGLAIAQKIVAAAGGSIDVVSRLGHGSTFTVHLKHS